MNLLKKFKRRRASQKNENAKKTHHREGLFRGCINSCLPKYSKNHSDRNGEARGAFPTPMDSTPQLERLNLETDSLRVLADGVDSSSTAFRQSSLESEYSNVFSNEDYFSLAPVDIDDDELRLSVNSLEETVSEDDGVSTSDNSNGFDIFVLDDASVDTIENLLLKQVTEWDPFYLDKKESHIDNRQESNPSPNTTSSPDTPVISNRHKRNESHSTPITVESDSSESSTMHRETLLATARTGSDLDVPHLDSDESKSSCFNATDMLSHDKREIVILSSNDESHDGDVSQSSCFANANFAVHDNVQRQELNKFLEYNSGEKESPVHEDDSISNYIRIFNPESFMGEDCSYNDNSSISDDDDLSFGNEDEQSQERDRYLAVMDDIGPKSKSFDSVYHSSMASV